MDFAYRDNENNRLINEPYWKQYAWMQKLGLSGARLIVFALVFERDCTAEADRARINSKYIADALDEAVPAKGRGTAEVGIARVFKVLNELAGKGILSAVMDEDGLSMSFKCDYEAIEHLIECADEDFEDNTANAENESEANFDDNAREH